MHLVQESVGYIIDFLHDDPATLVQISLVSRAWIGRTRTHLCKSLKITRPKLLSSDPSYLCCSADTSRHFTLRGQVTSSTHPLSWIASSSLNLTLSSFIPVKYASSKKRRCFANVSLRVDNHLRVTRCFYKPRSLTDPLIFVPQRR